MLEKLQFFSCLSARGRAKARPLLTILFVFGLGCVVFLGAMEIFYRFKAPYRAFGGARELPQFRRGGSTVGATFVVDPDFGFRPVFDNGHYTASGTLANDYPLTKSDGKKRDRKSTRLNSSHLGISYAVF